MVRVRVRVCKSDLYVLCRCNIMSPRLKLLCFHGYHVHRWHTVYSSTPTQRSELVSMDTVAPVWSLLGGSGWMNRTFLTEVETPFGAPTRPSSDVLRRRRTSHLLINLTAWRRSKHLEHARQEDSSEEHLLIGSQRRAASAWRSIPTEGSERSDVILLERNIERCGLRNGEDQTAGASAEWISLQKFQFLHLFSWSLRQFSLSWQILLRSLMRNSAGRQQNLVSSRTQMFTERIKKKPKLHSFIKRLNNSNNFLLRKMDQREPAVFITSMVLTSMLKNKQVTQVHTKNISQKKTFPEIDKKHM